ncbi:MAG: hypothetical protein V4561_13600 [Bacteroidota bacterium]
MKIKIITLLLFSVLSSSVSAQVSVVNKKGTITAIDSSKWTLNGANIVSKNTGNVGLGNPSPTYKLDVTGKARVTDSLWANTIRATVLNSGTVNDSILVADPVTGILKRMASSRLNKVDSTTASNGLNLVSKDVKLGGALTGATTITTTGVNTLAIDGLQSGATTDSLVVAEPSTGVLKMIEQRQKPTIIKTTTTQANSTLTSATINTLSFTTIANKNYRVRLWLRYNSAATTTGIRLGPNTFSGGNIWYQVIIPSSTTANQFFSGFNTGTMLFGTASRATTGNVAIVELDIEATSAATVSFQFASEIAGSAITIQADSRLEYEITN